MSELELVKILGSAGGGMALLFVLTKAGLLKISIGTGNTYTQSQMDKAEEDSKWKGQITEKLEDLCERMDEVKGEVKAFAKRLSDHLRDEEQDVRDVRDELKRINAQLKK